MPASFPMGRTPLITAAAQLTVVGSSGDQLLIPVLGARQNFTFKSGLTYYIGGPVELYGQTTIEGGAVLKFNFDFYDDSSLLVKGGLTCKTGPYNPAILTSIDDDTAGEYIFFSSRHAETVMSG